MKKNKTLSNYLKFQLSKHISTLIFLFALGISTFPLIVLAINSEFLTIESSYPFFIFISVILLVSGFVFPIILFDFTNHKKSADFYYSLPVKRQTIFLQQYVLGLIFILVPITISTLLGIFSLIIKGSSFFVEYLLIYLSIVLVFLAIYNIVTFVIQKCNNLTDSYTASLILINIPVVIYYSIVIFLENSIYGFPNYYYQDLLVMLSPIYGIFAIWTTNVSFYVYLFYLILMILIPIFASILFYTKRAEQSSEASVSKMIYPLIKYVATFTVFMGCLVIALSNNFGVLGKYIFAIGFSLVTYLTIDALSKRGFNYLKKTVGNFVAYISACLVVVISLQMTGGYGYAYYLPVANEYTTIEVNSNFFDNVFNNYSAINNPHSLSSAIEIVDSSAILAINDLHKAIIDQKKSKVDIPIHLNFIYDNQIMNHKRKYTFDQSLIPYSFYQEILASKIYNPIYQPILENQAAWLIYSVQDNLKTTRHHINYSYEHSQEVISNLVIDVLALDYQDIYQTNSMPLYFIQLANGNGERINVPVYQQFTNTIKSIGLTGLTSDFANIKEMTVGLEVSQLFKNCDSLKRTYSQSTDNQLIPTDKWKEVVNTLTYTTLSEVPTKVIYITYQDNSVEAYLLKE